VKSGDYKFKLIQFSYKGARWTTQSAISRQASNHSVRCQVPTQIQATQRVLFTWPSHPLLRQMVNLSPRTGSILPA